MANFDELQRLAENKLGKETANRIVAEVKRHSKDSADDRQDILYVESARFPSKQSHDHVTYPPASLDVGFVDRDQRESGPDTSRQGVPRDTATISHSAQLVGSAIKWEYAYGMLGLVLGLAAIIGGIILGLHGVTGATSWTAKVLGLESKINDAAPGVVLFIVGLFMVFVTKPKVRLKDVRG
jgi:hypothetical protein